MKHPRSKPRKRLNLRRLEREMDRALEACHRLEWWDGATWRPHGTFPGRDESYRAAIDRLGDILATITGSGSWAAVKRFGQAANALRKRDARKAAAEAAWRELEARFGDRLRGRLTKDLITDCAAHLRAAGHVTGRGASWSYEGVRSLVRRGIKRL